MERAEQGKRERGDMGPRALRMTGRRGGEGAVKEIFPPRDLKRCISDRSVL